VTEDKRSPLSRYHHVKIEDIQTPKTGREVVVDHYWAYRDGHVFFFKTTPQCNTSREIIERCGPVGSHPRFIPLAYIPREYL